MLRTVNEKLKRKRRKRIGGFRVNFFPGEALIKVISELERRRRILGFPGKFTKSFVFREGAWMFVHRMNDKMDKALKGELHAKKRV